MFRLRTGLIIDLPTEDDILAAAGPVKTYKLTDEELQEVWRKYGPPKKKAKQQRRILTKEILARRLHLQQRSINQVAYEFGIPVKLVEKRIQEWGLDAREEEGQCMSG